MPFIGNRFRNVNYRSFLASLIHHYYGTGFHMCKFSVRPELFGEFRFIQRVSRTSAVDLYDARLICVKDIILSIIVFLFLSTCRVIFKKNYRF